MINLGNQTARFLFAALVLSASIHITLLMALPLIKGFPFIIPFASRVMTINLQGTIESDNTPVKAPRTSLHQEDEPGENIYDEYQETHSEKPNSNSPEQIQKDYPVAGTSADSERKPERSVFGMRDDVGTKADDLELKAKPLQTARSARERFSYDIYWLGIHVGNASLEAMDDNGVLKITSRAHSSGFISTFYKVVDYAESLIVHGMPAHFRIKQNEGKYKSDKETIFNAVNKNIAFFNYLKGTKDEHPLTDGVAWDVISGFYYLRTQPLEIGKTICINIFDSNKFYKAEINVLRKEKIALPGIGEVNAIIVKPQLKTDGLFQRKGDVLIWLTDDEKRMPVRIETKVPIGDVVAKLRDFLVEK